jgi:predicted alpha/beta-hydrolase family hydrolase
MKTENIQLTVESRTVSAVVCAPEGFVPGTGAGVIIAHGAGNDMHTPLVVHTAEALAAAGHVSLRFNFPYKEAGRKAPDPPRTLMAAWTSAYGFLQDSRAHRPQTIIACGKSMGGRIAAAMVAEGRLGAAGLAFLGYPLHPAGQRERLRDAPLYAIRVPMLFFCGTRDPLCDLDLLKGVTGRITAPCRLEVVAGGDHSFNVPKSQGLSAVDVRGRIAATLAQWLREQF